MIKGAPVCFTIEEGMLTCGKGLTRIFLTAVSLQPLLFTATVVTVNIPAVLYCCGGGFWKTEVLLFGKLHCQFTIDVSGFNKTPKWVKNSLRQMTESPPTTALGLSTTLT